jgi:peptidyl-prolyl cis-trans isomerase C
MSKYRLVVAALLVGLLLSGCDNIPLFKSKGAKKKAKTGPPAGERVVAKVGDFYITSDELNREVENYNTLITAQGRPQDKIDTVDKKISYLRNEVVRKYILYEEALKRDYGKKSDIAKELENAKVTLLVSALLRDELERVDVSSKEVEDFYNQNKEYLKEPQQRRVREIVTSSEDEAKQVYIELLKGSDFSTMARQSSKAASKDNGGDIGFLTLEPDPAKRVRFDKFYEMAFSPSLEAGGISSIFKGVDGYYIIKVESIKETEAKSLSELWDNIKSLLLFEKQQKAIADLASKLTGDTDVEIFEGKVD